MQRKYFGLFRIWTLCFQNLGLGFGFGFKLTDLDRIRILKSKIRTSLLSTFLTSSTLVPFFISENKFICNFKTIKNFNA